MNTMNFHRSSLLRLLLPTIRVFSQMETAPSVSISTINIYIYIYTHVDSQKAANKYRRVNARSRVCVHVSPLSFSLSLFTVLAKYGRSGGGGSSLSVATRGKQSKRPSVESGQPVCPPAVERERERDLHLFQVSLRSFSLSLSLSLLQPLPHLYTSIRLVSNRAATNCTEGVPTLYLSFADAARYEWNQKSGRSFTYDQPSLSLSLSL